jgi:hypothetical protein
VDGVFTAAGFTCFPGVVFACVPAAGWFCTVVCAAFGALAAGAAFCAANGVCCWYTVPAVEAFLLFV